MTKRKAGIPMLLCALIVCAVVYAVTRPDADKPIALCPHSQHAVLVGFGKDTTGAYLATYGCER